MRQPDYEIEFFLPSDKLSGMAALEYTFPATSHRSFIEPEKINR